MLRIECAQVADFIEPQVPAILSQHSLAHGGIFAKLDRVGTGPDLTFDSKFPTREHL